MRRMKTRTTWLAMLALGACASEAPRYGALTVGDATPRGMMSGQTSAQGGTADTLSPGCPGFVDASRPDHIVHVTAAGPYVIRARSMQGPLALVVAHGDEVRCDSDGGGGHAPSTRLEAPGDYAIYVGALHHAEALRYELDVAPATTVESAAVGTRVSVTVTSEPSGAAVRTPDGTALGTTPAMFVLPLSPEEVGRERTFVLEMAGRRTTEVSARLTEGSVVVHGALPASEATTAIAANANSNAVPDIDAGTPMGVLAVLGGPPVDAGVDGGSRTGADVDSGTRRPPRVRRPPATGLVDPWSNPPVYVPPTPPTTPTQPPRRNN